MLNNQIGGEYSNSKNDNESKISSPPPYPYLTCIQCQERILMQQVLPTAPDQCEIVFEENITYPVLPALEVDTSRHHESIPMEMQSVEKKITNFEKNSTNSVDQCNTNVTKSSATQKTSRSNETEINSSLETSQYINYGEWKKIFCEKLSWISGLLLFVIGIAAWSLYKAISIYLNKFP